MEFEGKPVEVELETTSAHFIHHNHNPKEVDIVICLLNNKKLPVKTIEIPTFEYLLPTKETAAIKVNPILWRKFKIYCVENDKKMSDVLKGLILSRINEEENE